ncbi:MAG: trypsin-like peptidase domain-containing protein [Candidatus Saccharimonadales bacterium]
MNNTHDNHDTTSAAPLTSLPPPVAPAVEPIVTKKKGYHQARRRLTVAVIFVVILFGAGIGGAQLDRMLNRPSVNESGITQRPAVSSDGNKVVTQNEQDITSVVSKVSPSVVSVLTTSQRDSPYFGSTEQGGAGTGIIIGSDGYVMTNKHVISGVSAVSVILADGTAYDDVKVVGVDPLNDIAFLKIPNVSQLPVAELGDSTSIRIGQSVIAIGNSLGQYQNTVTSGIVSGTGRPISAQEGSDSKTVENLTDLIQTDAAINPGNSGGPLLNLHGHVIGINTAVAQDAQGIGFSIPIGATKGLIKEVLAGRGVQRAFLGVNYIPITADVAKHYKLAVKQGAYVYKGPGASPISVGSPAAAAGLKDKDIITKVGQIPVGDRGSVASLLGEYAPGDTIELTVMRADKTMTVKVTLAVYSGG